MGSWVNRDGAPPLTPEERCGRDPLRRRSRIPLRDGYIPGVPCWVDVSEPDPEAALEFYGSLFGWVFEDVMPPSSDSSYFIAWGKTASSSIFDTSGALRSGDVAAIRS